MRDEGGRFVIDFCIHSHVSTHCIYFDTLNFVTKCHRAWLVDVEFLELDWFGDVRECSESWQHEQNQNAYTRWHSTNNYVATTLGSGISTTAIVLSSSMQA